jgi:hypothetical protein
MRIGFFFFDNNVVRINIDRARTLIEEGGDWDRRNRLKAYEGAYLMSIRDFKGAAGLFLDTLSTFTSTELMEYNDFVKYAVLTSLISIQRVEIKKRVRMLRTAYKGDDETMRLILTVWYRYWTLLKFSRSSLKYHTWRTS